MPPVVWRGPLLRVPVRQAPPGLETETRRAQNTSLFEDEDEAGEMDLEMEMEETRRALFDPFCSVLFFALRSVLFCATLCRPPASESCAP